MPLIPCALVFTQPGRYGTGRDETPCEGFAGGVALTLSYLIVAQFVRQHNNIRLKNNKNNKQQLNYSYNMKMFHITRETTEN